jgi:hypothetical protein
VMQDLTFICTIRTELLLAHCKLLHFLTGSENT